MVTLVDTAELVFASDSGVVDGGSNTLWILNRVLCSDRAAHDAETVDHSPEQCDSVQGIAQLVSLLGKRTHAWHACAEQVLAY
jgi:hypothetical protein